MTPGVGRLETAYTGPPRVVLIASTKANGRAWASLNSVKPVAVVTPRARHASRGIAADHVVLTEAAKDLPWLLVEGLLSEARGSVRVLR